MKSPRSESLKAFRWNRSSVGGAALDVAGSAPSTATYVPLDDFIQVEVMNEDKIRQATKIFLSDHGSKATSLSNLAARGKLIAELNASAKLKMTFGEFVKRVEAALRSSESAGYQSMDGRELA